MNPFVSKTVFFLAFTLCTFSAPVDQKKDAKNSKQHENKVEFEDLGIEYGRYLQEVVSVLEQDKDFAKKLENVSADHIKSGAIANELNFVNHQVRSKLDELKRIEMDRIHKLTKKELEAKEFGEHVDHGNPHSFEVNDLHKLIVAATKDLEELDKKRREEFKQYEMEKEHQYREHLKNLTDEEKKEVQQKHDADIQKHKDHPRIHHPGSKQQLEEVWEEQDHMPKEEFNPKTFFMMHDINGDGYLDTQEVEALLTVEIKKLYDPNNPEDDPNEMMEEYHRMREHIYKEADKNRDGLISKKEFLEMTQRSDFNKDEPWKGLDDENLFDEDDLREYEKHREEILGKQYGQYQYQPQYMPHHAQYPPNQQHMQMGQYHPQGNVQFGVHPGGQAMDPRFGQQIHPSNVNHQMHQGMNPQMNNQIQQGNMNPQIQQGINPQMQHGMNPQMHSNVNPQVHPGNMNPQMHPNQQQLPPANVHAGQNLQNQRINQNQVNSQNVDQHPGLSNSGLPPQQHPPSQVNGVPVMPQQGGPSARQFAPPPNYHPNNIQNAPGNPSQIKKNM